MIKYFATVGKEIDPVKIGQEEQKFDEIVLLCSKQSKPSQQMITINWPDGNVRVIEMRNEFDFNLILDDILLALTLESPLTHWSVNITAGTKPMSIATYEYFTSHLADSQSQIYYIQNSHRYDLSSRESHPITTHESIREIIERKGCIITKLDTLQNIGDDEIKSMEAGKTIFDKWSGVRTINEKELRTDNKSLFNSKKDKEIHSPTLDLLWDSTLLQLDLTLHRPKSSDKQSFVLHGLRAPQIVFNGLWFEIYMATILQKWRYSTEIAMNVEVAYNNGNPKNETDIIVNTPKKLFFIECKTQIFDVKDISKIKMTAQYQGGKAAKTVLITYIETKEHIKQRCKDDQVLYFHFKPRIGSPNQREQLLFEILESEFDRSNL